MRVQPFSYIKEEVAVGPELWTPAQITTYTWIDPSDSSTVTLASGVIEQIDDQSGNGHHLLQNADTSRRAYYSSGINGLNCIDLRGSEVMYLDDNNGDNTTAMYFVAETTASSATNQAIVRRGFGSESLGYTYRFNGTTGDLSGFFRIGSTNRGLGNLSSPPTPAIYEVQLTESGGNTTIEAYHTANSWSGPSTYSGVLANQTDDVKPVIGGAYTSDDWGGTGFSDFFRGFIGEIIYITGATVTSTNQDLIQGYLAWKWGLEGDLPVGHPYKNAAPTI